MMFYVAVLAKAIRNNPAFISVFRTRLHVMQNDLVTTDQKVGGSNPLRRAKEKPCSYNGYRNEEVRATVQKNLRRCAFYALLRVSDRHNLLSDIMAGQLLLSEYGSKSVHMWLDRESIVVNGANKTIDVAPRSMNGRTMVPIALRLKISTVTLTGSIPHRRLSLYIIMV